MIERGQFFTKKKELKELVFNLPKNNGRTLEPSCGAGHLCSYFEDNGKNTDIALEIDKSLNFIYDNVSIMDFFDYSIDEKFDTIYGNPPYVKQQLIENKRKIISFSNFSSLNLYLYFIEKSFYHLNNNGEIVFIIPREFLTSSRAKPIRKLLYENGTITDIIDFEERRMFDDADPYVIIIRYEKNNYSHKTNYTDAQGITVINDEFFDGNFIKFVDLNGERVGDFFDVKVGIVSGKNEVYQNDDIGNIEVICSNFIREGKKKKYIFYENFKRDAPEKVKEYLQKFKKDLISRRIRTFNEENWMNWGAIRNLSFMKKEGKCIYVNSKTRAGNPFFIEDIGFFDGSVLALFPKKEVDLKKWVDRLNNEKELKQQGFLVGNKYQFSQNGLTNYLLTKNI